MILEGKIQESKDILSTTAQGQKVMSFKVQTLEGMFKHSTLRQMCIVNTTSVEDP